MIFTFTRSSCICVCARDHVSTLIVSELSLVHNTTLAHRFVSHLLNCEQRCVVTNASDKTKQWNRQALTVSLCKTHAHYWHGGALIGIEIQLGRPNKSRLHVTYWIHPDMNCNRFHILTVIACVCGYLIEDVCFSPLPLSVALFLTIPSLLFSLSTSRLRTSLFDVKEDAFFVIEGVLQCKLTTCILKVVYILCIYCAHMHSNPYVIQNTPELKTQPL